MRGRVFCAVAAAAAMLTAGCGGSSEDEGGADGAATASITKAAFIEQVDSVCKKVGKRTEDEFNDYAREQNLSQNDGPSPAQTTEIVETILVPALQQQADEIRAVGVPAGDEAQVEAILREIDDAIASAEGAPEDVESPEALLADADKLISKYGFKVCGQR